MRRLHTTDRLVIYYLGEVRFDPMLDPRRVYLAFLRSHEWPGVVATCTVNRERMPWVRGDHAWIDWLEVSSEWRRKGIGREFVEALRAALGRPIHGDPIGEDDGEASVRFCDALGLDSYESNNLPAQEASA